MYNDGFKYSACRNSICYLIQVQMKPQSDLVVYIFFCKKVSGRELLD